MKRYISFLLSSFLMICASSNNVQAQEVVDQLQPLIKLRNGSFEDEPYIGRRSGKGPDGWRDCGKLGETSPDVHPAPFPDSTFFEVTTRPSDGNTYLGMVVRDNITWESIGQRLRTPMKAGNCYNFSIDLARSKRYVSPSKTSDEDVNYEKAAVLRVWGSNSPCGKLELLDETDAVENHSWRTYNTRLEPSRNYSFLILEVFYKTPVFTEYNGNMLLDNASNLIPVPCDKAPEPAIEEPKDELIASPINTSPKTKKTKKKEKPEVKETPTTKANGKPVKKKKEYLKELDDELLVGQEITLKNLYFDADSFVLSNRFYPIVDDVFAFLEENEKVVIELGGHTNNRCEDPFCNSLSEERAESVANYLIQKGIIKQRVKFKGYGKTSPKYPNNTPTNRRRNQRVEIKILSKG
jgi:outer membrane protein OmpA-like peptidoglycan-associated protein